MRRYQIYRVAGERVQAQDLEPLHEAGEDRPLCLHTIWQRSETLHLCRTRRPCLDYNQSSI